MDENVHIGYLNGLFVLSRYIGLLGVNRTHASCFSSELVSFGVSVNKLVHAHILQEETGAVIRVLYRK